MEINDPMTEEIGARFDSVIARDIAAVVDGLQMDAGGQGRCDVRLLHEIDFSDRDAYWLTDFLNQ
jgi:hypothetical protein